MSDSVRPLRRQPTRLPHPWDSPDKNTGVGCHFLLQCMKVKSQTEVTQSCLTLSDPHGLQPTRLLHPWDFPGKSTGVGCHCLLLDISKIKLLLKKKSKAWVNFCTCHKSVSVHSPCLPCTALFSNNSCYLTSEFFPVCASLSF